MGSPACNPAVGLLEHAVLRGLVRCACVLSAWVCPGHTMHAAAGGWLHAPRLLNILLTWLLCHCVQVFQLVEQQGGKPSGQDLAPLLHLYKARLALACQNHKAAKKEVRQPPIAASPLVVALCNHTTSWRALTAHTLAFQQCCQGYGLSLRPQMHHRPGLLSMQHM